MITSESGINDCNDPATKNKNLAEEDNSNSVDSKLSGKSCHVGGMESKNDKLDRFKESDVPEFIADIGLLNFSKNTRKPVLSYKIKTEITKLCLKYFQSIMDLSCLQIIAN